MRNVWAKDKNSQTIRINQVLKLKSRKACVGRIEK